MKIPELTYNRQINVHPPSVHVTIKQGIEGYLLEVLKIYKVKNPLVQETLVCTFGPEENLVPVPQSSPCKLSVIKKRHIFTFYRLSFI